MKDLQTNKFYNWLAKKVKSPTKAYDLLGHIGFGAFFLLLLYCILLPDLGEFSWGQMPLAVISLVLYLFLLAFSGYCLYSANLIWLPLILFGVCDVIMGFFIPVSQTWTIAFIAIGAVLTVGGIILAPIQIRNNKKIRKLLQGAEQERSRAIAQEALEDFLPQFLASQSSAPASPTANRGLHPQRMHKEEQGAWKQLDYRWPSGFGYDYILRSAQWLIDRGLTPMTLVTCPIAGAQETEHIETYRETGNLADTIGQETGVVGLGGMVTDLGGPVKIYWYNQTNIVRLFVTSACSDESADAFAHRLLNR